jgi:hypothetical protein
MRVVGHHAVAWGGSTALLVCHMHPVQVAVCFYACTCVVTRPGASPRTHRPSSNCGPPPIPVGNVCDLPCICCISCVLHRSTRQQLWWPVCAPVHWSNHVQQRHLCVQGEQCNSRKCKHYITCSTQPGVVRTPFRSQREAHWGALHKKQPASTSKSEETAWKVPSAPASRLTACF